MLNQISVIILFTAAILDLVVRCRRPIILDVLAVKLLHQDLEGVTLDPLNGSAHGTTAHRNR
jgi:hypothetical protein